MDQNSVIDKSRFRPSWFKLCGKGAVVVALLAPLVFGDIFMFGNKLIELIADSEATDDKKSVDDRDPAGSNESRSPAYTKPVEKIILLGERHSGTNWITDHLTECFQNDHLEVCAC